MLNNVPTHIRAVIFHGLLVASQAVVIAGLSFGWS